jgi:hypothetical protein
MSSISAGVTTGTALVSTGDTTGNLDLKINGSTQAVRVNTSGAIGVGTSPAFGTSGQVLTSGGSSAAPTWSDLPPGAGSFTAVATGSIAAGAPVSVNSDGTVSTSGFVSGTSATEVSGASLGSVSDFAVAQKPGTNFLVTFERQSVGGFAFVRVVPVSGTSFSSPVASVQLNGTTSIQAVGGIVYEPVSDTFVAFYPDNNGHLAAQAISINFTSGGLDSGTKVVLHTQQYYGMTGVYTTSGKVLVAGWNILNNPPGTLSGFVLTVSGTTITAGTRADLSFTDSYTMFSAYDTASGSVVITTSAGNGVIYRPTAVAATISGTSITFGSTTLIENVGTVDLATLPSYNSSANKTFVVYTTGGQVKGVVLSVSGTTITVGTIAVLSGSDRTSTNSNIFSGVGGKTLCNFSTSSVHNFVTVSISGTTVTFDTPTSAASALYVPVLNSTIGVLYYRRGSSTLNSVTPLLSNTTSFAGFSSASYTNGQTATINSVGSSNSSQTGLTTGVSYEIEPNGTIGTGNGASPSYAGIALSATRILVKG